MKHLFTNGCSFMTTRNTHECSIQTHAGMEVAKHYNLEHIGIAKGGRGMDRTALTTITWCERNRAILDDTFVLIEWSTASRLDYPSNDKNYKKLKDLDTCWHSLKLNEEPTFGFFFKQKNMHFNEYIRLRYYQNVLLLQNYLKVNNINYLMYNGLETRKEYSSPNPDFKLYDAIIDDKHFFDKTLSHHHWNNPADPFARREYFVSANDHHPTQKSHEEWAKLLIAHIDKNNLLKK